MPAPSNLRASLLLVFLLAGCAGTDGVTIGDGPTDAAPATTPMSTSGGESPGAIPESTSMDPSDAGPADFDTPVPPPETKVPDAGAPPQTNPQPPPTDPIEAARVDCVKTINLYRASVGRAPLARWNNAEACVDAQAGYDAYYQQAHAAFRQCTEVAQNECPTWPGATPSQAIDTCLQAMWAQGPSSGNFRNLTSSSWSHVACGIYRTTGGRYWLVQNFR